MRVNSRVWVPMMVAASLGIGERAARAGVGPDAATPPDGWQNVCSGNTIDVKPTVASRVYSGTGACWINTAQNKSDGSQQSWVRVPVTFEGSYALQSSTYAERLVFSIPSGSGTSSIPVTTNGSCSDDPWATGATCGASTPNVNLQSSFGWLMQLPAPPLSRNVFGASLVAALLKKQASSPPLAPVDLDAVRWPAFDGNGTLGRVFWRAPDVSGNKWILAYDIEYAINSVDSAFSLAGHVVGPGAKTNLSPSEISRFYYTTFKLQPGDYYFRVCAVNDAGRQCSAPLKAREPSKAELMAVARNHAQSKIVMATGGPPPPASPPPPAVAPPPARVRMAPALPAPGH
jgi:hypothetical protein